MPQIDIRRAATPKDIAAVRSIFADYLSFVESFLGQSLAFQDTQAEFAKFPQTYDALFLAAVDGAPMAACGIKPFKPGICELKRLYCRPDGRGNGLGLALTKAAIRMAHELEYSLMYLDTDHGLTHANGIYDALGFQDIEKYYDNPMDSRFMALAL